MRILFILFCTLSFGSCEDKKDSIVHWELISEDDQFLDSLMNINDGRDLMDQLKNLDTDSPDFYAMKAMNFIANGDATSLKEYRAIYDSAYTNYLKGLQIDNRDPLIHLYSGLLAEKSRSFKQAIPHYKAAIDKTDSLLKLNDTDVLTHLELDPEIINTDSYKRVIEESINQFKDEMMVLNAASKMMYYNSKYVKRAIKLSTNSDAGSAFRRMLSFLESRENIFDLIGWDASPFE